MTFFEYWTQKQTQERAEVQALIKQSQHWVGRRVKIAPSRSLGFLSPEQDGEVERIDERGNVYIVVGFNDVFQPRYYVCSVSMLGQPVTLVEE